MSTQEAPRVGKPLGRIRPGRRPAHAERLIRTRLARALSQDRAAGEIGVSRTELARWEAGRGPRLPLYRKVLDLWLVGAWPVQAR